MKLYGYTALNEQGRTIKGVINAANEVDLEERLKDIGLDLIFCKETKERRFTFFNRITLKDIIILCVHLEQLERSGVPILDALSDIRDTTESPKLKSIMVDIYESVKGGQMLSEAMGKHPKVFDTVFTSVIEAGEKTGNLTEAFAHLANHLKWVDDLKRRVTKATIFPIVMVLVLMGVISVMMLLVVPKLVVFLESQGIALPALTRALISTSNFFTQYYMHLGIAPFIIIAIFIILKRTSESFRYRLDAVKLSFPIIGPTLAKIELARFCHFFAITFTSGLGILECLTVAHNGVTNLVIKDSIFTARKAVSEGSSLTEALRLSNQFPSLVIRMFKVGEESGNFDMSLQHITFFYDKEVRESVDSMIAMIQPTLTFVLGLIMVWIISAIFGPLYMNFENIKF